MKNNDYQEKIKNGIIYHTCVRQNIESVEMPNFLLFCFELSKEDEYEEFQYINLIKYNKEIISFIEEKFSFNNIDYIFYGAICMPSDNHYSSYYHLCLNEELNLENDKSYYYDGLINKGKI